MRAPTGLFESSLTPLTSLIVRRWRQRWICQDCVRQQLVRRTITTDRTTKAAESKPYYVTSPPFNVDTAPHVGHMYTMVLADVLKRWQQLKNRKAILCAGVNEHGMKIQQAAVKADVEPQEMCDKGTETFQELAERTQLSHDIFARTTEQRHVEVVEYAWQVLQASGDLYEMKHEGWYSLTDEMFYSQDQVQLIVDPATGRKIMVSKEIGNEVKWTSERSYHFRLSAYKDRLLEFYESNPSFIIPKLRMDKVVKEVQSGLLDLPLSKPSSISTWGVAVPSDRSQTVWVWLDALISYASAVGYPFTPGTESAAGWPPDVHVIGKDTIRFHCIYWPAFLMALDLPLPKHVLAHGNWTLGKQRMVKPNAVNPFFAMERFGTDVMRWYLSLQGRLDQDTDYDNRYIIAQYKKDLQSGLGSLTSRVTRGKYWNLARAVSRYAHPGIDISGAQPDVPLVYRDSDSKGQMHYRRIRGLQFKVDARIRSLYPNEALQLIMEAISRGNKHLEDNSPWKLYSALNAATGNTAELDDKIKRHKRPAEEILAEIDRIIYLNAEVLRLAGIMLQAYMPETAKRLLDMLGVSGEKRDWTWCQIGKDDTYGTPFITLGEGRNGVLFPGLTSDF